MGHKGRSFGSRSSGGFATTLMQKYIPWTKGRGLLGADPRGGLEKQQTIDQPGRQVHAKQRTIGFQGGFASKNYHHRCPNTNLIAPLRTRQACVQIFNISEKTHGFAPSGDVKWHHHECSRCLKLHFLHTIGCAHQGGYDFTLVATTFSTYRYQTSNHPHPDPFEQPRLM